jgi:serine phosphatase RsbU (regulator of sigma subunit)
LQFSGAFNPLYIIREDKIIELKGDRFSVGLDDEEEKHQGFTSQFIQLLKNDMIYLFSDGFADQFGGPEGKKFKYRRFRHVLLNIHSLPLKEQKNLLEQTLDNWRGSMEQVDDVLVIGFKPEIEN